YNILLRASPRRRSFTGRVEIDAQARTQTDSLELHARGLRLLAASVVCGGKRLVARVQKHKERETVSLHLPRPVRGRLTIVCDYDGKLGAGMHGLYLAQDGTERAIVSQCEATDARAIFPCLDEPAFKAKLAWQVQTDAGLCVVTNGVPRGSQKVRGKDEVLHTFAPTHPVSTYLSAVTIGHFEASRTQKVLGTPCRVLAGVNKVAQTAFAQSVTAFVLPYYTDYFGQRYRYQKLDQVAVPGFDAGAMENVGAIFYRQTLLLMQQDAVSWSGQKRIAEVIAHEIAHQWFGNLVTMQWWDDLWLNEAFATWIAYKVCDVWHPEWRMWDDFFVSKMDAMHADGLASTHPIY
ncbi:MAG: M1 family peptidase, partial [Deltaproteobacteria bacterium]